MKNHLWFTNTHPLQEKRPTPGEKRWYCKRCGATVNMNYVKPGKTLKVMHPYNSNEPAVNCEEYIFICIHQS